MNPMQQFVIAYVAQRSALWAHHEGAPPQYYQIGEWRQQAIEIWNYHGSYL